MTPADAELVGRAREGDRDAFAALLSLDRLRRPESFGAWLVGIGLNAARVALRGTVPLTSAELRGTVPLTSTQLRGTVPLTPDPAEIAEERDLAARVRAAIAADASAEGSRVPADAARRRVSQRP